MNSMVYGPEKWEQLLAAAKKERHRLGLDGKVILSHNFTHHLEIADDYVGRMTPAGRAALRRYIRGLDALSLSQYMDLIRRRPGGSSAASACRPSPRSSTRWSWPREELSATTSSRGPSACDLEGDPTPAHRGVRRRPRRPQAPEPLGRRDDAGRGEGPGPPDRARPCRPRRLPRPPRRTHGRQRRPLGHRPPLRHLRLGEAELRQPRGDRRDQGGGAGQIEKARPRLRSRARSDVLVADAVADVEAYLVAYLVEATWR